MESDQPVDDAGGDGEIDSHRSPERMEIDTTVLPSTSNRSEKQKDKQTAKDEAPEPEQDTFDDVFGDQPLSPADALTIPVTDDASLTASNKKTTAQTETTTPKKEKYTPEKEKTTPEEGIKTDKPETGVEEAVSGSIAAIQTPTTPNSRRKLATGNRATNETVEKLRNAAKEVSEKIAQLEKQQKDLQKRIRETDDRGSKAELGKQIGQLGKEMKTLQNQQKSMLNNQDMDEIERGLENRESNRKALKEEIERLAYENANLKKMAKIPPIVFMGSRSEPNNPQVADKIDVQPVEHNAEELARGKAENKAHAREIAKLEAELRQAQEAVAKNEADPEDEDARIYTRDELNEMTKTYETALRTNAEDMANCIAENKAYKKRIFKLEAELSQAQESARSSEETTAKLDDTEAGNGDMAESEAQQRDAEAGNGLSDARNPDAKDSEIETLLHTNADLESKLANCFAHGRTLQSQVDGLKKQLKPAEVVDAKEMKGDLEERIADLRRQLQESRTEVVSLKSKIPDNATEIEKRIEELVTVRKAPEDATIEELLDERETLEHENQKLKDRVVKLEAQALISSSRAPMETLSGELVDCNANVVELKRQVDDLEAKSVKPVGENSDLEVQLTDCENRVEELKGKVKEREVDIAGLSHDNTDLVRRLAYSESGVRTTEARRAFDLAVEVEVARILTAMSTWISDLSSQIQGVKEAYTEVIKSIGEDENDNGTVLKSSKKYQDKIDALEAYLESQPQYLNDRAPNLENTGIIQSATGAEMIAEPIAARETINRLRRQMDDLREQNRRLRQDKTDIEKEQDSLGLARNQDIAPSQNSRDEAIEGPNSGPRAHTQSQHDELEACQNEKVALQTRVDKLSKRSSELREENRFTFAKAAHNLQMYEALQSQMKTLEGAGDMGKNEEIRRLQKHNSELQAQIADRDISIGELKGQVEELYELLDSGNDRIRDMRSEVRESRLQKDTDDEELNALQTQVQENLQRLAQMEADQRAAEGQCDHEKQALSEQIAQKDEEISTLRLNATGDHSGDLARCNEERDRLRDELVNTTIALEQCRNERQQLQSATYETPLKASEDPSDELAPYNEERDRLRNQLTEAENDLDILLVELEQCRQEKDSLETQLGRAQTPQNVSPDPSGDLARCHEDRDLLRDQLTITRADLDRCRQEHQRLETELARAHTELQRSHANDNIPNQPADPNAPSPRETPDDDLTNCRAENHSLKKRLQRAYLQIQAIQRAHNALDPRAELARRETDLTFADEAVADLRAELQAAVADFSDMQDLNTYLQDRLGQLLREIFRLLQQHLGLAPPRIAPPHHLAETEPWLRGLAARLAEAQAQRAEGRLRDARRSVVNMSGGTEPGNLVSSSSSFLLSGVGSCAACTALAAAVEGELDRTYVVRAEDFEEMRRRVDEIVWNLEGRVRRLERLLGRLWAAVGSDSDG